MGGDPVRHCVPLVDIRFVKLSPGFGNPTVSIGVVALGIRPPFRRGAHCLPPFLLVALAPLFLVVFFALRLAMRCPFIRFPQRQLTFPVIEP